MEAKIVPFRCEYYELIPERRHLVKTLTYPVPNPAFPFWAHFTKMIDESLHVGPNAILAFKLEGYHETDFSFAGSSRRRRFRAFENLCARILGRE